MGCSFSGLNALYDAVNGGGDVWINENRFRILRQLGEGGFAYVFLVKEVLSESSGLANKIKDSSHLSVDGNYAMKKVLIQNNEQLQLVKEEIRVSSLFNHPNLLPLLDHAIIAVKSTQEAAANHEAYLLFPVHLDGTLLDHAKVMKTKKEFFSTTDVLHIFRQLCAGLKHMHSFDPPYAHNDVKPGNVLLTHRKGQAPLAILMDFGSARPARKQIRPGQKRCSCSLFLVLSLPIVQQIPLLGNGIASKLIAVSFDLAGSVIVKTKIHKITEASGKKEKINIDVKEPSRYKSAKREKLRKLGGSKKSYLGIYLSVCLADGTGFQFTIEEVAKGSIQKFGDVLELFINFRWPKESKGDLGTLNGLVAVMHQRARKAVEGKFFLDQI
ncbi:Protein kinase domain [Dillenia turbinata]|uniref:non-specific serine/threonine protein kinase n=1 Tax=Dillenia turbinata TaxID=194707 RepID=A0AAN8Z7F0_9MAGN